MFLIRVKRRRLDNLWIACQKFQTLDVSRIKTLDQLKSTELHDHMFAMIDVVEMDSPNPDVKFYMPIYSNQMGEGFFQQG